MLKLLLAVVPIATALSLGAVDSAAVAGAAGPLRDAIADIGECANVRMMDAAAVADGSTPPLTHRDEPWDLRLHGRGIASVESDAIEYCGRTTAGTRVTLSDGTTAELPGRARLVSVENDRARFETN